MRSILLSFGIACLLATMAAGGLADPNHAGAAEASRPITFYAHNFTIDQGTYPMDRNPPSPSEVPQAEACSECAGDTQVQYNFTTSEGLATESDIDTATEGRFQFYVRPHAPADGASVPVLTEVRIRFQLWTDDGSGEAMLGQAWSNQTIEGSAVTKFEAAYDPRLPHLDVGAQFRWNVLITGQQGTYNPLAVPYGVSEEFPFLVSFHRIEPVFGFMMHPFGESPPVIVTGQNVSFNFTLDTHASKPTTARLAIFGVPDGVQARLMEGDALAAETYQVEPGEAILLRLELAGLQVGTHTISVNATTLKGEAAQLDFTVTVVPPPTTAPAKRSPSAAPILALIVLVGPVLGRRLK